MKIREHLKIMKIITDGEEKKESQKESDDEYIFKGSRLSVKEFRNSFLWLCQKLEMKKGDRKILLDYIKFLMRYIFKVSIFSLLIFIILNLKLFNMLVDYFDKTINVFNLVLVSCKIYL